MITILVGYAAIYDVDYSMGERGVLRIVRNHKNSLTLGIQT
jgi:hypothetical protein